MKKNGPQAYQEWLRVVIKQMSHLSKPQALVLGMWSFALAMTHFCGLSTVTVFLAEILEKPENTVKERLRQWYLDGGEKKGKKRSLSRCKAKLCPVVKLDLKLVVIGGKKFGLGGRCFNFKDMKRGGLGWHHTKMTDTQRAERLWERDRCCHLIFS